VNVIGVNFNDSMQKAECCSGQAISMLAAKLDDARRPTDTDPHKPMVEEVPLPTWSSDGSKNGMKIFQIFHVFHFDAMQLIIRTILFLTATTTNSD